MSNKRNRQNLNQVYGRPLPLVLSPEVYGPLPELYAHNPLSWLFLGYRLLEINFVKSVPQLSVDKIIVKFDTGFVVTNEIDMARLWSQGFFGKGNLSRSEPTWKSRINRRLNNDKDKLKEDMTNFRRQERKKFKLERSKIQLLELKLRSQELTDDEKNELARLKLNLELPVETSPSPEPAVVAAVVDNSEIEDLEYVELQPTEVFFLKFALNVIEVENIASLKDLFRTCCSSTSAKDKFILDYVVYHHYRSLGWCVRSGIKFGSDMLLYKRGPPFSHAEYAIIVIPNDGQGKDWVEMLAIGRVIGAVKKNLVLVYVDFPSEAEFQRCWNGHDNEKEMFIQLMALYRVTEVIHRRWVPSKSRD